MTIDTIIFTVLLLGGTLLLGFVIGVLWVYFELKHVDDEQVSYLDK